jgi:enoyl-CoA hydratase
LSLREHFEEMVIVESDGPVSVLTLNRPETLNAFDRPLTTALIDGLVDLPEDRRTRVVVITGKGRAFSAGGDIGTFETFVRDLEERRSELRYTRRLIDGLLAFHLPVIAAVNGPAVGLGCTLATLADLLFISEETYLADPHVNVGLVAGDGGGIGWPANTSLVLAKRYLLTGDRIPAAEAVRIGLANEAVPPEELLPRAVEMAHRIARQPPQAVQDTKFLLNLSLRQTAVLALSYGLAAESQSHDTQELKEIVTKWGDRK